MAERVSTMIIYKTMDEIKKIKKAKIYNDAILLRVKKQCFVSVDF